MCFARSRSNCRGWTIKLLFSLHFVFVKIWIKLDLYRLPCWPLIQPLSQCVAISPFFKWTFFGPAQGSSISGSLPGCRSAWLARLSPLLAHRCTLLPTRRPHCSLLPCFAWKNLATSACLVWGADIFCCAAHMSKSRPGLFNSYRDKHLITELTVRLWHYVIQDVSCLLGINPVCYFFPGTRLPILLPKDIRVVVTLFHWLSVLNHPTCPFFFFFFFGFAGESESSIISLKMFSVNTGWPQSLVNNQLFDFLLNEIYPGAHPRH